MTDTVGKLRIDQAELTLGELADVEEALGCSLGDAFSTSQARAIAALAYVTRKRFDPGFTFTDALTLRMADLDIVAPGSPGETPGGANGTSPPASPEPGP